MSVSEMLPRNAAAERDVGPAAPATVHELLATSGMRTVVIGASKDPNAKITLLLVDRGESVPRLAVKVPTTDAAAAAVNAEGRLLVEMHRRRPDRVLHTIPRVVDLVEFEGRTGVVMTAMPGVPMTTSYLRWRHTASRDRVQADFAAVGQWLEGFQLGTARQRAPIDMAGSVMPQLAERFSGTSGIDTDLERLAALHERLRPSTTPRTAVHGDFWCGNILISDGQVSGVVDWEAACVSGDPLRDLVRFALMYALYLDRHTRPGRRTRGHRNLRSGEWGAGVSYAIAGSGWFPDLFRRFLAEGLKRLGAPPASWRDAALCGIGEVAATTDDEAFARKHLELFRRLTDVAAPKGGSR